MFSFFKKIFLMAATGYMLTAFTAVYAQQNAPAGNADPEFKSIEILADETAQLLAEKVNRFEGVIISYKGEKMVEVYSEKMNAQKLHPIFSITKGVTSCAVGFAIQEGLFSLESKVVDLLAKYMPENPGPNLSKLTVRDLLMLRPGYDTDQEFFIPLEAEFIFAEDPAFTPGEHFYYGAFSCYLLSKIISETTGMTMDEYIAKHMFEPLGITNYYWVNSNGVTEGYSGIYMTLSDMAKLGEFYRNSGAIGDKQLLNKAWFDDATKSHTPEELDFTDNWKSGYGYLFWRNRFGGFRNDRFLDFVPYLGMGYVRSKQNGHCFQDFALSTGMISKMRIIDQLHIILETRGMMVKSGFDLFNERNRKWDFMASLTAGLQFTFGPAGGFKRPSATTVIVDYTPYTKRIANLERDLGAANMRADQLQKALNAEKNKPGTQVAAKVQDVPVSLQVFFNINSAVVSEQGMLNLQRIAESMKATPNKKYTVVGYADSATGTPSFNQTLSRKRAEAVVKILTEQFGISKSQVSVEYKGGVSMYKDIQLDRTVIIAQ